jgi:hypothetical protein
MIVVVVNIIIIIISPSSSSSPRRGVRVRKSIAEVLEHGRRACQLTSHDASFTSCVPHP